MQMHLKSLAYRILVMDQLERVRLILLEEFVKAQARNPNYSMRAYAKKIGIAQSAVSEILSGKRRITRKSAQRILVGLDKDQNEVEELINSNASGGTQKYSRIEIDTFQVISDWYHFAILSLAETKDFQSSASWIANRLGISERTAETAIETLLRLKMLAKDSQGHLLTTNQQFEVSPHGASTAIRKANSQNIELITAAHDLPVSHRDFTAITLCFDPDQMDQARNMIRNFRRDFNKVMESGKKKEVYKLCVQLFPLTKEVAHA